MLAKAYKLSETYAEIVEKVIPSALEEINTRKFLFGDELFISAGRSIKSEIVPGSAKKPEPCIKVHSENVKKAPEPHFGRLKVLVGKIIDIKKHPEADSLFVETVDVGEVQPRTICSGLVGKVPIENLDQKLALFCCNLKAVR
ncbi:Aminoacyl tRNA synthase complex-interacting multifunctional protein 1 [Thelohanellus kitauei]|uniref:Aminoacyl tRNA synthase complex-interacting multifunctional protein 1 n=1 Tax=Thelohanellus kitauei TaxID=669202 RepID=A0A0C2MJE1_THEKT|nr:Aminoacyl tRNA synthase complex-interacting multifunctional protein 1 [Thelohanellus kitauei]